MAIDIDINKISAPLGRTARSDLESIKDQTETPDTVDQEAQTSDTQWMMQPMPMRFYARDLDGIDPDWKSEILAKMVMRDLDYVDLPGVVLVAYLPMLMVLSQEEKADVFAAAMEYAIDGTIPNGGQLTVLAQAMFDSLRRASDAYMEAENHGNEEENEQ